MALPSLSSRTSSGSHEMVGQKGRGRRAVFLDRDGVIVVPEFRDGRSFAPTDLENFEIYPDAPAALEQLKAAGFLLIVVTNQPDVGAGRISRETLDGMHKKLRSQLPLDGIYACMHTRDMGCTCRKPQSGMLVAAAHKWGLDFSNSYLIGDRSSDMEAARAVGCRSIFVEHNYHETETILPDYRVASISEAVIIVVRESQRASIIGRESQGGT